MNKASPIINAIIIIITLVVFMACITHKADAKEEWNEGTYAKYEELTTMGFNKEYAKALINECKRTAVNPVRCIKTGAFIAGAESSMATRCHRFNCVGMNDGAVGYTSVTQGVDAWVAKYNRYWWKQTNPSGFYRADGIPPVTHYCMGKKRDGVCPEGTRNSWKVFNSLSF